MKLSIESKLWEVDEKSIGMEMFLDTGMKTLNFKEIIPSEVCKNKHLMKRIIDKMFYELKIEAYKHFSL